MILWTTSKSERRGAILRCSSPSHKGHL
jgi:hypothetical protein